MLPKNLGRVMKCSMCQLLLNKPHNDHLAALFLEVTHLEFASEVYDWVQSRGNTIVDFNVGKYICSLALKVRSESSK